MVTANDHVKEGAYKTKKPEKLLNITAREDEEL
jgi:hypothetical protein